MASPKHLAMLNAGPGIMWGLWPRLGNGSPRDAPLTGTGGTLWEGPLAAIGLIACIEDQDVIDRILAHLRAKEQNTPTLPHLAPPTRAPPETLALFVGMDSSTTALHQQGSQ